MCSANIRPRSSWLPDLLLCFLIVGLALGLYVRTLAPSVLISDLSEYQFVLYELGIPHPTGYPLYVLLGHLWSRLPIGSVAYRINLFSAVLGALALAMLYLALRQVIAYHGLVLGLTLFFAVAPTFWSQVLVAGTYPLNALLFALLLYLVLRYMQGRVSLEPVLLAYGFGLAHHRTMILLGPALLVLVTWQRHERWNAWRLFKLSTCLFAPLLLYVYIPMRAPQIGRNELTSFSGLLHYLSGQTFVGLLFQQGWTGLPGQIGQWLAWTVHEFTPLGMLLALGGLGIALYRYRALGTFTLLAYLGYLAFNLNYYIGNIWIYYIPCYMLILCWIAVFLEHMYGWVGRLFGTASSLRVGVQGALTIALIGTAVLQAVINYRTMDMSHEYTMENLWLDALALPLAEGGAVLANWDKHTSLVYYQRVEGKRPDLLPLIATDENTNRALAEGRAVYAADLPPTMQSFTLSCVGPLFEIRAQPRHLADVVISHPTHASFGTDLLLHGYDFAYIRRDAEGNERYLVTLYWSRIGSIGRELAVSVRLRAGERQLVQVDGAPVRGCYPPSQWRTDEVVIDQYTLVLSLLQPLPDRAALFIVVYTRDDLQPLQVKETGETAFHLGAVELGQYARPTNQRPHPGSS